MNLKTPLELPILWNSREANDLKELGLSTDNFIPELRTITFYTIDHIYPYWDDRYKKFITCLISSAQEYLTDKSIAEVKLLISES